MSHIIYLALGSNLGNRSNNLQVAIGHLAPQVNHIVQSKVYETEPWGYSDQPLFLNQVIKANTELEPQELLTFVKDIEALMGRTETFRFGPRVIDLDILFYDDLILTLPDLSIPHPRIAERAFILVPLAEIAPELSHPIYRKTILQLKSNVDTSGIELYRHQNP